MGNGAELRSHRKQQLYLNSLGRATDQDRQKRNVYKSGEAANKSGSVLCCWTTVSASARCATGRRSLLTGHREVFVVCMKGRWFVYGLIVQ